MLRRFDIAREEASHRQSIDEYVARSCRTDYGMFRKNPRSRRGSQVVRQRSAKPLFGGSIPPRASKLFRMFLSGRVTFGPSSSSQQVIEKRPNSLHHSDQNRTVYG